MPRRNKDLIWVGLLFILAAAAVLTACSEDSTTIIQSPTEPVAIILDAQASCNVTGVTIFCTDRTTSPTPEQLDVAQFDFVHLGIARGSAKTAIGSQTSFEAFSGEWSVVHTVWDKQGTQHLGNTIPVTVP